MEAENMSCPYGYELIIDLHRCNVAHFSRANIDAYFEKLCYAIKMQRCERYWWDDKGVPEEDRQTSPHTKGTSAVQFILTSSIVIHTLDLLEAAYINIFSCKIFDWQAAEQISIEAFAAVTCKTTWLERG